ncbi:hypothetical protein ACINWC323_2675 [Acinetobacter sp. WC-323]|nr:hypothetical protein ACINWC323_2675 [Acinetobacter sp. WC-323]
MIFWIMLIGICAAFSISNQNSAVTNIVLCALTIFCFATSTYVKYFLGKA